MDLDFTSEQVSVRNQQHGVDKGKGNSGGKKLSRRRRRRSRDEDDGLRGCLERFRRRKRSHAEKDDRQQRKHGMESRASCRRRDSSSLSSLMLSLLSLSSSYSSGDERRHRGRSSKGCDSMWRC